MTISSEQEIIELLNLPYEEFEKTIIPIAKDIYKAESGNKLIATGMVGYTNICKNSCLYCGMRAAHKIPRYRIPKDEIVSIAKSAKEKGFTKMFLIAGEDPLYGFDNMLYVLESIKNMGMYISLAAGEFSKEQYKQIKAAGADRYVLKFEMSQEDVCNRMKPSTTFKDRMKCIEYIKEAGMELGSGNIADYPGQTIKMMAEDIMLMKKLDISWAPVIPYMPVKGTPLALEGGFGDVELCLKQIAILRIMMHGIDITAQIPGKDPTKGIASIEGNKAALDAGANLLFVDLVPTNATAFNVVDNRVEIGMDYINQVGKLSGMTVEY